MVSSKPSKAMNFVDKQQFFVNSKMKTEWWRLPLIIFATLKSYWFLAIYGYEKPVLRYCLHSLDG